MKHVVLIRMCPLSTCQDYSADHEIFWVNFCLVWISVNIEERGEGVFKRELFQKPLFKFGMAYNIFCLFTQKSQITDRNIKVNQYFKYKSIKNEKA